MRERLSIPKPHDIFAADMLQHVADKFNAPECSRLKVKVALSEDWMSWHKLGTRLEFRQDEYAEKHGRTPEDWMKVNGFLFQVGVLDTRTGKREWASESQRKEALLENGVAPDLADALSPFDAVIFLNVQNIKRAASHDQPFPLHSVVTHECVHIIERRTGRTILKDLGPYYLDDTTAEVLGEFLQKMGKEEFLRRYVLRAS